MLIFFIVLFQFLFQIFMTLSLETDSHKIPTDRKIPHLLLLGLYYRSLFLSHAMKAECFQYSVIFIAYLFVRFPADARISAPAQRPRRKQPACFDLPLDNVINVLGNNHEITGKVTRFA